MHAVISICQEHVQAFSLFNAAWLQLWQQLWARLEQCTATPAQRTAEAAALNLDPATLEPLEPLKEEASCQTNECLQSGICCGMPLYRNRPPCAKDSKPSSSSSSRRTGASSSRRADRGGDGSDVDDCRSSSGQGLEPCSKTQTAGVHRTGGIFTFYCIHGICYCFCMMPGAEGRNEAFSFLLKYFARPPQFLVYDHVCALEEYCQNRAPAHFAGSQGCIDNFHFSNHTACALAYSMAWTPELARANSQINEQANSALQSIKRACSSMTQANFMRTVRLWMHLWNEKKIQLLQVPE